MTECSWRQRGLPKRLMGWVRRYGFAEILGTTTALLSALIAARLGTNTVTVAMVGAWGEVVGFYLPMLLQEFHAQRRNRKPPRALWYTLRNLLLEFGPAELLDTGVLRPTLIVGVVQLIPHLALGVIAGKLLADCFFYGMAIVGRQVGQRLVVSSD